MLWQKRLQPNPDKTRCIPDLLEEMIHGEAEV